jgi:hypothetical protein
MRWVRRLAQVRKVKIACTVLFGKPGGKRSFGKPSSRCMDIKEKQWENAGWIHEVQD